MSMVRQPIGPTTHWSENPLVRRPVGPKTHRSEDPLVRKSVIGLKTIGPKKGVIGRRRLFCPKKSNWSENPLVRRPVGKKTHWSENPLVWKSVIGPKIAVDLHLLYLIYN